MDPALYLNQGDYWLARADLRAAMRWYSRAIEHDARNIDAWVSLARAQMLRGDLRDATTWITRGLTLYPQSAPLLGMRAVLYARRGLLRQALNNSDLVLEKSGGDPVAHMARGEVMLLASNKSADYCFEQAVKLTASTDWRTPFLVGLIYQERRVWARAIQFYAAAAERNEREPAIWWRVGVCRAELGQKGAALKAYQHAEELCPDDDPLILKLNHARAGSIWRRLARLLGK